MKKILSLVLALLLLPLSAGARPLVVLKINPLYQADYETPLFEYKGEKKSVSVSGCGTVCVSMVLSLLVPEAEQTPESLFLWANEEGYYKGNGLSLQTLVKMLKNHGVESKIRSGSIKTVKRALKQGQPIIVYVGKGYFSDGGHYILLYGYNSEDKVCIVDPNSDRLSTIWYPLPMIFDEMATEHSLLVCKPPEK